MAEHDTLILSDIREEAKRLAEAAVTLGLSARLIGGLAIWLRCPSVREGPFARSYDDMDFAISAAAGTKFKVLLMTQGYLPDQFFNGLHGATRLYYGEPAGRWSIDVRNPGASCFSGTRSPEIRARTTSTQSRICCAVSHGVERTRPSNFSSAMRLPGMSLSASSRTISLRLSAYDFCSARPGAALCSIRGYKGMRTAPAHRCGCPAAAGTDRRAAWR